MHDLVYIVVLASNHFPADDKVFHDNKINDCYGASMTVGAYALHRPSIYLLSIISHEPHPHTEGGEAIQMMTRSYK